MKEDTKLCHVGRPREGVRMVNPPVERGSTVMFPDYDTFRERKRPRYYGRHGTDTHDALKEAVAELESAASVTLTSSGLSAVCLAILAFAEPGTDILVTDTTYDPVRSFCEQFLKPRGVSVRYYDPLVGTGIKDLIRRETALIHTESPGSLTFEVQDLPAICEAAGNIPVTVDNTWGGGVFLKPLEFGAAISIQAATKYMGGHSDVFLGTIASRTEKVGQKIFKTAQLLGNATSPDDVYTVLRGLRTLPLRLREHERQGLALARWLEARPEVAKVLHPGLESHPQHALWKRDFSGASGLFSVILERGDEGFVRKFIDSLNLYGLGYSWGGYESLCLPAWPKSCRSATSWDVDGQLLRFHAGLEAIDDLTNDLAQAFDKASVEARP
ncbi:cystathionine beta-lyase [Parvularcula lutaonensis]|uniref:Cystathionine beta-lyase n=1 Tax=Parvularcula lutaonensis TaxID=491923 RepID=A0ABV7M9J2_9PROT|nr:cystathionine beta-lyase [Parvularcula lutaonensis]GGY43581.1 cystathionine beta-lyase [Parvularcula lutaonensis]